MTGLCLRATRLARATVFAWTAAAVLGSCADFSTGPGWQLPTGPIIGLSVRVADRSPAYVLVGERINVSVEAFSESYFTPATGVTFESADTLVATISNSGQLRGKRAGTVVLTIRGSGQTVRLPVGVRATRCSAAAVTRTTSTDATLDERIDLTSCALDEFGAAEGWRLTLATATTIAMVRTAGSESLAVVVKNSAFETVQEGLSMLGRNLDDTRAVRTLAAGTYYIFVASPQFDSSSAFTLRVTPRVACSAATATTPIVLDVNIESAFSPSSCVLPDGRPAMQWVLQPTAATIYAVQTTGRGEVVYGSITGPDSLPLWATQSVVQRNSSGFNVFEVPPGRSVLWVAPWSSDTALIAFTTTVRTARVCAADASRALLALGDTVRSFLDIDGCLESSSSLVLSQPYTVNVAGTGTLQYDLITTGFNGLATSLKNPLGQIVPVTVEYDLTSGTARYTASVTPGLWQLFVTGSWNYTPDADFALALRSLPEQTPP